MTFPMAKRARPARSPKAPSAPLQALRNLSRAGRHAECLQHVNALLSGGQRSPELLQLAGRSLVMLGRDREALQFLDRALADQARAPASWAHRAIALGRLGEHQQAARCDAEAQRHAPRDANVLAGIAQDFAATFRYREATAWFERAVALAPGNVRARLGLARILERRGNLAAAREVLDAAIRHAPEEPDVILGFADALASAGRFDEAERQLVRLLERRPHDVAALSRLPQLRRMTSADAPLLERMAQVDAPNEGQRIALAYAMGKVCDDLGRHADAFAHFADANARKRRSAPAYDPAAVTRTADLMIASHGGDVLRRRWPGASDSQRPVLIVGMPRSGTSLVEQILAAHPMVHGAGEQNIWGETLDRHRQQVFFARYDQAVVGDIAQRVSHFLETLSQDAARVIDKMPANFRFLGPVHVAFPGARVIHVHRHPIDNCLSIHFQNFGLQHGYATDLADLGHYYRDYCRLMSHWREHLPAGSLLEVSYEALVADPESWARRLVAFVGLAWHPACLAHQQSERGVGTASKWQVRQPIYRSSVARWKNYEAFVGPLVNLLDDWPDPLVTGQA